MQQPQVGDRAPDVPVLDRNGRETPLSTYWRDRPCVLGFLRHDACVFCQEHVLELREERGGFRRAGARVVLVGLGSPDRTNAYCAEHRLPFVCVSGPGGTAHRAYGLRRGSLRQVLGPQLYLRWAKLHLLPEIHTKAPRQDIMQMPGTFVIDTDGVIRFAHRNRDVADNPSPQDVLDVLKGL
jgi:peroxiredoxin